MCMKARRVYKTVVPKEPLSRHAPFSHAGAVGNHHVEVVSLESQVQGVSLGLG
jgi:hypothetical protein